MLSTSFLQFIKSEKLFQKNEHLLLAISGGLDSVVLAHLLVEEKFSFSLAHMNFQLRGEDSNQDEQFIRNLADKLEVEVFVKKVQINKELGSTQVQARELRYDWFDKLLEEYSFDKILTAHHANDLLETALLNISRGTGIKGIRSILPLQNRIARPLLFAAKFELQEFAESRSIEWREDLSNSHDHYTRNKIRHHVIPPLLELNPNLLASFQQTVFRLRATEKAWEEKIETIAKRYLSFEEQHVVIDLSILNEAYVLAYLSELLAVYGFSLQQLQAFDFARVGAQLFSSNYVLTIDRDKMLITKTIDQENFNFYPRKISLNESPIITPYGTLKIELVKEEKISFKRDQKIAFIAFESLKEPLEIDLWEQGDKIQPIGMKGKKKISDILIDQKVPLPQKNKAMVLKSGGEIVWVIGYKFSELFKVKEETTKILRIEYENS
ncbi:tRNA(Ile)-lysidine synthase [Marivirga sericea]|uniref:tRNA(Ile)-lysidine synthase n=1 Tax=Marivirga sericea TaxID=1028 RepID=A0A1X7KCY8_9BACT|nr:tRNA lysidine(34) synthetase TilS [Marivirga sericea]SMG38281.1 tRNA(Ile)-lysidine synthase [Marivirga sericea]